MDIRYHIGHKCNLKCKYCTVDQSLNDDNYDHILDREIDNIEKSGKQINRLLITGGEPSLYKERVYKILDKYRHLKKISIVTNGTDPEFACKINEYSNVKLGISWDGANNDRDFDSIETIKIVTERFPNKVPSVQYVVENSNYHKICDDVDILNNLNHKLVDSIEMRLVTQNDAYYKFDKKIFRNQLVKLIRKYQEVSLFNRSIEKKCRLEHPSNELLDIESGYVRYGCVRCDVPVLSQSCSIAKDVCMNCDIDSCFVCTPALITLGCSSIDVGDDGYINNEYCKLHRLIHEVILENNRRNFFITKMLSYKCIELTTTMSCNMNCSYCYQGEHKLTDKTMSRETIDDIIELLTIYKEYNKSIPQLFIIGGEPIFGESLTILEYLTDRLINDEIDTELIIFSNGYLMSDRVIKFYKKLVDNNLLKSIQISLDCGETDGIGRVDHNKCNTYKVVNNHIKTLSSVIDYKFITVNTVVDMNNSTNLLDHLQLLDSYKNSKIINSYSIRLARGTITSYLGGLESFKDSFRRVINAFRNGSLSKYALIKAFNMEKYSCDNSIYFDDGMCQMIRGFVSISPDGEIVPCNAFLSLNDYKNKYIIGNVKNLNINENIYNIYDMFDVNNRRRSGGKTCETCSCFESCFSCRATNIATTGEMNSVHLEFCKLTKTRWKELKDNLNVNMFKTLTSDEKSQLVTDIKELERLYSEEKSELSDNDLTSLLITLSELKSLIEE